MTHLADDDHIIPLDGLIYVHVWECKPRWMTIGHWKLEIRYEGDLLRYFTYDYHEKEQAYAMMQKIQKNLPSLIVSRET